MITTSGKTVIKRFYAGQIGQIASSMSLGVGDAAAVSSDVQMQYEAVKIPIMSVAVDSNSDRIVFRATLPVNQIGSIYEVGLWSSLYSEIEPYNLNVLNYLSGSWTNGALTTTNARVGANALQINYVANGTTNAELNGFNADLSKFSDYDSVVVGYYATTNLSSLRVRLGSDSNNYWELLLPSGIANKYNIARVSRSAATKIGNPDWKNVSYIAVRPSATSTGSGSVYFDGIRLEPNASMSSNILVARSVLLTPQIPDSDLESDIEYSLRIGIG